MAFSKDDASLMPAVESLAQPSVTPHLPHYDPGIQDEPATKPHGRWEQLRSHWATYARGCAHVLSSWE